MPSFGDPRAVWTLPFTRRNGLAMLARVTRTDATTYGPMVGFFSDNAGLSSNWVGVVYLSNGVFLVANSTGGTLVAPGVLAAGSYWALAILSATSSFAYLSFDDGLTFKLLGVNTRTSDPVYATISNYSAPWQVARATVFLTVPRSPVISATVAVVPTVGPGELLTNGNMETGDPPTSWAAQVSATLDGVADERTGGAGSQSLDVAHGGASNPWASQAIVTAAGTWYRLSSWLKQNTAPAKQYLMQTAGLASLASGLPISGAWTNQSINGRAVDASTTVGFFAITATLGQSARFDDASMMALTTLTTLAGDAGTKELIADFAPATVSAGYQGGGECCASADGLYYLRAWIDRTAGTVNLLKNVNGTQTVLVSSATGVVYSAAGQVRIVICAPAGLATASVAVYYQGVIIGTVQTVDLTLFGTLVNGFSTEAMNVVVQVQTGGSAAELGVPQ